MNSNFFQRLQILVITAVLFLPLVVQSFPFLSKVYWLTAPALLVVYFYFVFTKFFPRLFFFDGLSICIVCALVSFFWGILNTSSPISHELIKDGIRGFLSLLAFLFACYVSKDKLAFRHIKFCYLITVVSVTVSATALGLVKLGFINELYPLSLSLSNFLGSNKFGTSLSSDGNFFSLSLILGIIAIFYFWESEQKPLKYLALTMVVNFVLLVGIGTGSRRFVLVIWPVLLTCIFILPFLTQGQRALSNVGFNAPRPFRENLVKSSLTFGMIAGFLICFWYSDLISYFSQTNSIDDVSRYQTLLLSEKSFGLASRLERIYYGFELLMEKPTLFGDGFSYRQSISCAFNNCAIDGYPHNAILSALLYGGVVGGFLIAVIFSYYLFYAVLNLFGGSFEQTIGLSSLVTFAFCFVSGDSIFSLPIFFTMLTLAKVVYANENSRTFS